MTAHIDHVHIYQSHQSVVMAILTFSDGTGLTIPWADDKLRKPYEQFIDADTVFYDERAFAGVHTPPSPKEQLTLAIIAAELRDRGYHSVPITDMSGRRGNRALTFAPNGDRMGITVTEENNRF